MSALRAAIETQAIVVNPKQIAKPDLDILRDELKRIQSQSTVAKQSESEQDDLAYALALAVWWCKPQSVLAFQLPWHKLQTNRPAA
jgi:hypothetical protein